MNKTITTSIANYLKRGIAIEILETDGNKTKVKITQTRLYNGYLLNQKQLVNRAKHIFEPEGIQTQVIPVVYSLDVDTITPKWINDNMEKYGIKPNDLVKQLAIEKKDITRYLLGKKRLSNPLKAAFYYYFLTYEINQSHRED